MTAKPRSMGLRASVAAIGLAVLGSIVAAGCVPAVMFTGTVSTADGQPVAGAYIEVAFDDQGTPSTNWTRTGPDGSFEVKAKLGSNQVTVSRGSADTAALGLPEWFLFGGALDISVDTDAALVLPPTATVTARVFDEGAPAPGAQVYSVNPFGVTDQPDFPGLGSPYGSQRLGVIVADSAGIATVNMFATNAVDLYADYQPGGTSTPLQRELKTGVAIARDTTLDFHLPPVGTLSFSGRVLTATGAPIPNALVSVEDVEGGLTTTQAVSTGPAGTFQVQVAPGSTPTILVGRGNANAIALGLPDWFLFGGTLHMSADTQVDLRLPPTVTVTARVFDQNTPAPAAQVYGVLPFGVTSQPNFPNVTPAFGSQRLGVIGADASGIVAVNMFTTSAVDLYADYQPGGPGTPIKREIRTSVSVTENITLDFHVTPI